MRRFTVATLIVALTACAGSCALPDPGAGGARAASAGSGNTPGDATVVRVVDGDTVVVLLAGREERVRLIGIDTPETVKPDSPVECFGAEASAHLHALLPEGTAVEVVRDTELRDRYDRLLAYLFRVEDELFVNLAMVADGYAGQLTIAPNVTFAEEFRTAVSDARRAGRGLWGACPDAETLFS